MSTVSVDAMKVGPSSYSADGSYVPRRGGKFGEMISSLAHGKYAEATMRAACFAAQTAATGVSHGTALGTTAAFCLYNPVASGKLLVVQKLGMGYISGTLGAGVIHITSSSSGDAVPTGTAIVPRPLYVQSGTSVATPLTTATITTNAAKQIGILCSVSASLASTAVAPWLIEKDIDGEIVIPAGAYITLHGTCGAGGSSPVVVFNATWEEVAAS